MMGFVLLDQMLRARWRGLVGWAVAAIALVAVMASVYPTIRQTASSLDDYVAALPPALREAFGLSGLSYSTPPGYLSSELYSAMFPVVILVMGIALAAWAIAGSESDGTLEMTLATPARRVTVAIWRYVGIAVSTALVVGVSTAALVLISPAVDLDAGLDWWQLWGAGVDMWAMCLVFTTITFAVGAAIGRRGPAIAVGAGIAIATYIAQLLGSLSDSLEWMRTISPWWWFLQTNPVITAPGWQSLVLPLGVSAICCTVGLVIFSRRDLHL